MNEGTKVKGEFQSFKVSEFQRCREVLRHYGKKEVSEFQSFRVSKFQSFKDAERH